MTCQIEVAPAAARQLKKVERVDRRRLQGVIELLAEEPRPPGAAKLAGGAGEWRVRSGMFRVIYEIDDGILRVLVLAVGHRREIYPSR